MKYGSQVI